eukprot:TRINITY_DN5456_c0_g1_i1.p1 TRINITY_DN5456_c0_g1~~TRINITY_DN5456_c0_g1_i1.p1  ORF type:complete len:166 (-),score=18.81 TRINITY_DN5456_c0_g1_i1:343-840(-)
MFGTTFPLTTFVRYSEVPNTLIIQKFSETGEDTFSSLVAAASFLTLALVIQTIWLSYSVWCKQENSTPPSRSTGVLLACLLFFSAVFNTDAIARWSHGIPTEEELKNDNGVTLFPGEANVHYYNSIKGSDFVAVSVSCPFLWLCTLFVVGFVTFTWRRTEYREIK